MFKPKFPKPLKNKFLVFLLLIYLIISIIMKLKWPTLYYYTINPIFWSLIIIYTLTFIKRNKLVKEKKYIFYALVIGLIYLFIGFMSGLLVGFVNSPFNHNFYSLWQNSVTLIIPIIGIELARNILINKSNINPILVTFFLILIELDFYSFFFTNNLFKFICSHIIPLLFSNMLFTYLTKNFKFSFPLIFRLIDKLFLIIFPIYPFFNPYVEIIISIIKFISIYYLFNYYVLKKEKNLNISLYFINYAFFIIYVLTLSAFMLGIFKYVPLTILSNSMVPTFRRGDAIIYEKIKNTDTLDIPKNKIIIYKKDNKLIAHRIIDYCENEACYITKGDNNYQKDSLKVYPNEVKGIYLFRIKYIGIPSILINELLNKGGDCIEK